MIPSPGPSEARRWWKSADAYSSSISASSRLSRAAFDFMLPSKRIFTLRHLCLRREALIPVSLHISCSADLSRPLPRGVAPTSAEFQLAGRLAHEAAREADRLVRRVGRQRFSSGVGATA